MRCTLRFFIGLLIPLSFTVGCMKSQKVDKPAAEGSESVPSKPDEPGNEPDEGPGAGIAELPKCPLPASDKVFRLAKLSSDASSGAVNLDDIRPQINAACKSCHLAPGSNLGGFTYSDSYKAQLMIVGEKQVEIGGFYENAERMRDVLVNGSMPPENIRRQNPEAYAALGKLLQAWIDAERPERGSNTAGSGEYPALWGRLNQQQLTDLGNCLPDPQTLGTDTNSDYFFQQAESLPEKLSDTDLSTMDSIQLAAKGTIAYNIEYPLWNDHTQKMRHIHVPAVIKAGKAFKPKALKIIRKDRNSEPQFELPENTRTYKTFFRGVKEADGTIRYRPVETRVIVTRYAPRKPLYGTYVWTEDASEAKLLTTPYRDGTAWKDLTLSLDFNRQTGEKRNYIVPARHRCEQCHAGAANESFVLGFTPLQINRRDFGEAGRDLPVKQDELNQIKRFVDYGLLTEKDAAELPKLEYFPSTRLLDDHTMRAQGYMLGNCAHCHNPKGYAKVEAQIPFDLSAGRIFNFDTNLTSKAFSNRKIVHHQGDLSQSYLFFRVAAADTELKTEARMPLHSLASPDCRAVKLFARWLKTYDPTLSNFDINNFDPGKACNTSDDYSSGDINAVEQDPTEAGGPYRPRREDWDDVQNGMGPWFRSLTFSDALHRVSTQRYAVDWWQEKESCKFPTVELDPVQVKPWMMRGDKPVKPFGQLYWTTPGAYFYNLTCTKCHGRLGEADGPLASKLDSVSGGSIRVANFRRGLFGGEGSHLQQFSRDGKDLSGNYFIWMALEGTRMNPPPEFGDLLGANKAQMLKTIMDRCARQIPSNPKATKPYFRDYDIFNEICTFENLPVTDPGIQYDADSGQPINKEALDAWLRKAAANAGWAIYDYVRSQLSKGTQVYPQTECESVFKQ